MKARETEVSRYYAGKGVPSSSPWFSQRSRRGGTGISRPARGWTDFTHCGLEHWGSDTLGLEKTRNCLLEWLTFMCRYIPVGLLERVTQRINGRPPYYTGRDYLESHGKSTLRGLDQDQMNKKNEMPRCSSVYEDSPVSVSEGLAERVFKVTVERARVGSNPYTACIQPWRYREHSLWYSHYW
uniref:Uncharacterized protein n=1 Tax=Oncorhynchus tshawytscha TaxID=74940 RepID=A0AAZ3P5G9_ONCTS